MCVGAKHLLRIASPLCLKRARRGHKCRLSCEAHAEEEVKSECSGMGADAQARAPPSAAGKCARAQTKLVDFNVSLSPPPHSRPISSSTPRVLLCLCLIQTARIGPEARRRAEQAQREGRLATWGACAHQPGGVLRAATPIGAPSRGVGRRRGAGEAEFARQSMANKSHAQRPATQ